MIRREMQIIFFPYLKDVDGSSLGVLRTESSLMLSIILGDQYRGGYFPGKYFFAGVYFQTVYHFAVGPFLPQNSYLTNCSKLTKKQFALELWECAKNRLRVGVHIFYIEDNEFWVLHFSQNWEGTRQVKTKRILHIFIFSLEFPLKLVK